MSMYWILTLDSILFFLGGLCTLFLIATLTLLIFLNEKDDFGNPKWMGHFICCVVTTVVCGLSVVFIPSTKQCLTIYATNGVFEFLEKNDKAKELPSKAVECIDKLLEEYLEE